jgi:mRNA interferase RelE/StbE
MIFTLHYVDRVVAEDIPALPAKERASIRRAIEKKLTRNPETFGKPLRRSWKGYRRLRVGDYRVIFRIEEQRVLIFCIGHRKDVYRR